MPLLRNWRKKLVTKSDDKRVPALRFKGFTDDWEQRKLGEICKVTKLAGFEFTKYVNYSNTGSILAIRGINVKKGKFNLQDVKYIDNSNFSRLSRSKLQEGDILFTYVGTIGNSAIVPKNVNWYLAPNVCLIRPQDKNSSFISYLIQSDRFQHEEIPKWITTSSQPALSMENIRKFKIILPLNSEQQKISSLVSKIDKLITLQQRKVTLLKRLKRTLLNSLISGKDAPLVRFKEFKSNWTVFKLEDIVAKTIKGNAKAEMHGKESIYLDTHYLNGGNPTKVDSPTNVFSDDIIILWDGSQAGKVYHGFSGALGSTLKSFTPKYSSDYLFQYLKKYQNKIFVNYRTPNIPHVIKDFTTIFKVNLPSTKEQITISKLLKTVDAQITTKSDSITYLKNMKQFLLQNMFI